MYYNYIKALHLIFVITWFAGLFYLPRLFIYHIEARKKPREVSDILIAQFKIMEKRLWYIITWPSAILAILFALWLLYLIPSWLFQSWMLIKIGFVVILLIYHIKTHNMFLKFQKGTDKYSNFFMRLWNEGATLLLFAIVFLIILRDDLHWLTGTLVLIGVAILLMLGIKAYKKVRSDQ